MGPRASGGLRGRLPEGMADAARLWLLLRIGLGLFALILVGVQSLPGPCHFELALDGWTTFPPLDDHGVGFPLVGVWQRWDACWYTKIAAHGYEAGTSGTAFYPLLPTLMRLFGGIFGGDLALTGMAINAVALVLALTGMHQLVATDFGESIARRSVLYLAVFPSAFFLFAPFTEALFLASATWALLAVRQRDWPLAIAAGLLCGLSRPQGLLIALPLAWEAFQVLRETGVRPRLQDVSARLHALAPAGLGGGLATVAPPVAAAVYVTWSAGAVGQSPLDAQALWGGRDLHAPWDTIVTASAWVFSRPDGVEAVNVAVLLLFIGLFLYGLRRLPVMYSLYVLPQLALVSMRLQPTPLTSTTRYMLVLFPGFVALALLTRDRPRLHEAWLVISILGLGLLTTLFLQGDFVA